MESPKKSIEDGSVAEGVFHLGASLAVAIRALRAVQGPGISTSLASAVKGFLDLCDRGAPEGCAGVAVEGLGFAARTLFPGALLDLDRELQRRGGDMAGYFWHGVGRGLYFLFPRALFSHESTSLALRKAKQEPPHEAGRLNALSGLAWAVTLVNIQHPLILRDWLEGHPELGESDAFSCGIASASLLWRAWAGSASVKRAADLFCYQPVPAMAGRMAE